MNTYSFNGNWIDLVIIAITLYFVTEGFRFGFFVMLCDFVSFLLSLVIALASYSYVSEFLNTHFAVAGPIANMFAFLGVAILTGSFFNVLAYHVVQKIPEKYKNSKIDKTLSILPSVGESLVICSFILSIFVNLPIDPYYKDIVAQSRIGGALLENTSLFNNKINTVFGKAVEETLTHLVIRPGSRETVSLKIASRKLTEDTVSETAMFKSVNVARSQNGKQKLIWDDSLKKVAVAYAFDMWERSFFGHYSPEGESVAGRLERAQISFTYAGENLALAPTVTIAHNGLMNSEGHRENILEENFKKIGIGVVDNGIYGKIFVQVFSD